MATQRQSSRQLEPARLYCAAVLLFSLTNFIVLLCGVTYRYPMRLLLSIFACGMLLIGAYQITRIARSYCKNPALARWKRRCALAGSVISVLAITALLGAGIWQMGTDQVTEHPVVYEGRELIAVVQQNRQGHVVAYYYDDHGPLFRGKVILIDEDYGPGDFDPFTMTNPPQALERWINPLREANW